MGREKVSSKLAKAWCVLNAFLKISLAYTHQQEFLVRINSFVLLSLYFFFKVTFLFMDVVLDLFI